MAVRARSGPRSPLLLFLLCAAGGCMGPPPLPPALRVPVDQFDSIRALCLLPIDSEASADPQSIERLESQIGDGLQALGFSSVDSEKTQAALVRLGGAAGGYYDVHSGQRDEARYALMAPKVRRGALEALGCQALVESRVLYVSAQWNGGVARWDGNSVPIGGGSGAYGTIGAISLHLRIIDANDAELYYGVGGIEPVSRLHESWFESRFEHVAGEKLLRNASLNREAVDIALAQIPRRTRAKR
jgi:hypothetical protein